MKPKKKSKRRNPFLIPAKKKKAGPINKSKRKNRDEQKEVIIEE